MKKLLEQKHQLIDEMKNILSVAETETRALSNEEMTQYEELKEQLDRLVKTIEELNKQVKQEGEQRSMEKIEKGDYSEELRAMTTTGSANAVPTIIADEIIKAVYERSSLIADIPVINSVGDLEFLLEQAETSSEFLTETETCSPVDLTAFQKIKATDKRIASMTLISKKLLNNSPAFTMEYIQERVADRIANGIEKSLLKKTGRDAKELTSGIHSTGVGKIDTAEARKISVTDILTLASSMKQKYTKGAYFIMNRDNFAKVSALTDGNGRPFVVQSIATDDIKHMLLGYPVIISENMDNETIALVNPKDAFRMKIGQAMQVQALQEKYAEIGQIGLLVDAYLDVVLVDGNAIKILNIKQS